MTQVIAEHTADLIALLDDAGVFMYAGPAYHDQLGYDCEALIGTRMLALAHPDDAAIVRAQWALIPEQQGTQITFRMQHADGSWRWFEARVTTVVRGNGRYIVSVARDVTERQQVEVALRESEERFRCLAEASFEGIVINEQGRHLDTNGTFATMLGYDRSEMPGKTALDFTAPESHALIMERIRSGSEAPYEAIGRRKDGSTFPVEIRARNMPYQGRTVRVTAIRDITVRKRAEQMQRFLVEASALLAASLDYKTTLDNVAHLVVPLLADWCVIDMLEDDGTIRTLAVAHADPAKEARGWELVQRYPIDAAAPGGTPPVLRTGQPEIVPAISDEFLQLVAADDTQRELLIELGVRSTLCVPLIARGRPLGTIALISAQPGRYSTADLPIVEDVARRAAQAVDNARLYEAERAARAEAEAAVRVRDVFVSVAAHELKTPLTALLGNTELLQRRLTRDGLLNERDQRTMQAVRDQSLRLARMVTTLLDISRIELGQLNIEREPLDLNLLAQRVVADVQPSLQQHTVVCEVEDEPVWIVGDELRLEQVLQNLVHNGIKYSPLGGLVRVHVRRCASHASIAVSDQGIGIPADALPQLFQRFYRAGNTDHWRISGLGIGLYVVREIVALHGGSVSVDSVEGQGTTFTIFLPLDSAAADVAAQIQSATPPAI